MGEVLLEGSVLLKSEAVTDTLSTNQTIAQGTSLSSNGYLASLQSDGNFVVYNSARKALWASNSWGQGTAPYKLILQPDNNLVLYDTNNRAVWASGTYRRGTLSGVAKLKLTTNGNLVLTDSTGLQLWTSNSGQVI